MRNNIKIAPSVVKCFKEAKERELEVDEVEEAKLEKERELDDWANREYEKYLDSFGEAPEDLI